MVTWLEIEGRPPHIFWGKKEIFNLLSSHVYILSLSFSQITNTFFLVFLRTHMSLPISLTFSIYSLALSLCSVSLSQSLSVYLSRQSFWKISSFIYLFHSILSFLNFLKVAFAPYCIPKRINLGSDWKHTWT